MDMSTEEIWLRQDDDSTSPTPEQHPDPVERPAGSLGLSASIAIVLAVVLVCLARAWHDGYNHGRSRLAARSEAPTCRAPKDTCQIAAELRRKILAPILDGTDSDCVPEATLTLAVRQLASAVQEHQGTGGGSEALQLIACQLDVYAQQAKARRHWTKALACVELFEILQPGTAKMGALREEAMAAKANTTEAQALATP